MTAIASPFLDAGGITNFSFSIQPSQPHFCSLLIPLAWFLFSSLPIPPCEHQSLPSVPFTASSRDVDANLFRSCSARRPKTFLFLHQPQQSHFHFLTRHTPGPTSTTLFFLVVEFSSSNASTAVLPLTEPASDRNHAEHILPLQKRFEEEIAARHGSSSCEGGLGRCLDPQDG